MPVRPSLRQRYCPTCQQFKPGEAFPMYPKYGVLQCLSCNRKGWFPPNHLAAHPAPSNEDNLADREPYLVPVPYPLSRYQRRQLSEAAHHRCAICGCEARRLAVDHCHRTNAVRGMLCTHCNWGLGYFRDDKKLLERAIRYLDDPPVKGLDRGRIVMNRGWSPRM